MTRTTICLIHYPVLDKNQNVYTTAITNIDVHDIARTAVTYGLDQYFLVSPIKAQRDLACHIKDFWVQGLGHRKNEDRRTALQSIEVKESIHDCIAHETALLNKRPTIIATSAKAVPSKNISYQQGARIIKEESSLLLLGTGYGLAPKVIEQSDYVLEPIYGAGTYNHLSVRSAAAIILDRLLS